MYWKKEQQEASITIATATKESEIDKAFTFLLPAIERMYESILFRYFSGNPEVKNEETRQDLFSDIQVKVYLGLKEKYDGVSSSFSYVQTIIKYYLISYFKDDKHIKMNSNSLDITDIEIADVQDTKFEYEELYINLMELVKSELENEINHKYRRRFYLKILLELEELLENRNGYDNNLHYFIYSYYISKKLDVSIKKIYLACNTINKNRGNNLQRLFAMKFKYFKNFEYPIDDINKLNNELYFFETKVKKIH